MDRPQRPNTAVYVTGLPEDITEQELEEYFSKCGVIMVDLSTSVPRVKIYRDEAGKVKGDGLVVYFRPESVGLATMLLDGTELRPGVYIQVSEATVREPKQEGGVGQDGSDRAQRKKALYALRCKLEWSEQDPAELSARKKRELAALSRTVLLRHLFKPEEMKNDPTLRLDITQDLEEECGDIGTVESIMIYGASADGSASVRFDSELGALACISRMHNRYYDGHRLEACIMTPELKKELKQYKEITREESDASSPEE